VESKEDNFKQDLHCCVFFIFFVLLIILSLQAIRGELSWKPVETCKKWPRVLASNRRDGNVATILPSCLDIRQFGRHATMENTTFDWPDGDYSLNYGTPEVPTSSSPRASQASPAAERADPPSGKHALPLLRLSG
jgi:hypothetical protein